VARRKKSFAIIVMTTVRLAVLHIRHVFSFHCELSVGIRMSFIICVSCQILLGDQMKKNEMGGACGTYGGGGRKRTVFWLGNLKEREHLEDLG